MSAHPQKVRVLVADDTPEMARRVSELLRDGAGVEVVGPACDGEDALRLFESSRPDGVVLDFNMPKRNGLEVLRAIRASDHDPWVIMLTNHDEPSIRAACLAAGANDFVQKATGLDLVVNLVVAYARG